MLKKNLFTSLFILWLSTSSIYANEANTMASKYSSGVKPSVVRMGNTIVEVHSSRYFNTLWYRVGEIKNNKIEWGKSYNYDSGVEASVAVLGSTVVEMGATLA